MKIKNLKLLKHIAITLLFSALAVQFYSGGTGAGNCLSFDGVNDYVKINNAPLIANSINSTVEVWIKANSASQPIYASIYEETIPTGQPYLLGTENSDLKFGIKVGATWYFATKPNSLTTNWMHVTGVLDAITGMKLYINGNLEAVNANTNKSDYGGYDGVKIGQNNWNSSSFNGQIDEVRIWNRALTQEEIRQNMCQKLKGNENGLVGYWRFDEASGNTAYDASGNGNNGTLY